LQSIEADRFVSNIFTVDGKVAAGPPDFELPPAVLPAFCATASVLVKANAAARRIVFKFMVVSSRRVCGPERRSTSAY
jgi:hypothetical protein